MNGRDHSSSVVVLFLVLLATGLRLAIVAPAPAPLNDGGLFYAFIQQLLANGLLLPAFAAFNSASIPFVYPPLAFYLVAVIHRVSGLSVIWLVQFLPTFLSVASIPAFFVLARRMLRSEPQAGVASLAFALLPRAFDWLIMGGGLTRSLGLLFAIMLFVQLHRLYASREQAALLPSMIFGALVVLSHPQASVQAAISAIILCLWYDRTRRGLLNSALVGIGVAALSSPWWIAILGTHGAAPVLAASAAAGADSYGILARLLALLRFDFTNEPFLRLFGVLGLLGMAGMTIRRDFVLPLWFAAMQLLEPRGATLFMMIPLAMAAGDCIAFIVSSILARSGADAWAEARSRGGHQTRWLVDTLRTRPYALALAFLLLYGSLAGYAWGTRIASEYSLSSSDLKAFEWVRANTAPESSFAVITGALPLRDSVSEWFPALTGRRSAATIFGLEWIPGIDFGARMAAYRLLQACAQDGLPCLERWEQDNGENFDYLYLHMEGVSGQTAMHAYLAQSSEFDLAYADGSLVIYGRR